MPDSSKAKIRRRWSFLRRLTLLLMRFGVTSEMVAIAGMVLGILAGIAFMATGETDRPSLAWGAGAAFCLLRVVAIQLDEMLQPTAMRQSREEEFYNELPERVSDAVTLLGFGFAAGSSSWLGLAAALAAIFSAYIRSLVSSRTNDRRKAGFVPMTRTQRLLLLSLVSVLMIAGVQERLPEFDLPRITLCVIVAGCLSAVILRWFSLRGIRV